MLWFLASLAALFSWGFWDFAAKKVVGEIGDEQLIFYTQFCASLILGALALAFTGFSIPLAILPLLLIAAVFSSLGLVLLARCIREGDVSIVVPITGTQGALGAIVSLSFFGESLNQIQSIALPLVIMGVPLLSFSFSHLSRKKAKLSAGVPAAIFCAISSAIFALTLDEVLKQVNYLPAIASIMLLSSMLLLAYCLISGKQFSFKSVRRNAPILSSLIVADFFANAGFAYALSTAQLSIAYPIMMSSPAVSAILAFIFFKERLGITQYFGLFLTLAGIALLGF